MTDAVLPPIAVLGAGSMGGAIVKGVVASRLASGVTVTNRTAAKADAMRLPGVTSVALEDAPEGNLDAGGGAGLDH